MESVDVKRQQISGAGCNLSVLTSGPAEGTVMVLVHGMRDHAYSMLFMSKHFPEYRLIAPDLRGHGDSDKPGVYGLLQFVADLHCVFDHFGLDAVILVDHSLGGHISGRFSSLYPDRVSRLVMLDGMGPPGKQDGGESLKDYWRIEQWHQAIDSQIEKDPTRRTMADREEAFQRLSRNNPRLNAEWARRLVQEGVFDLGEGVAWKWDSRVDMIWTTFSHEESEAALHRIHCPVLIVTGEYSLEYWTIVREHLVDQDDFYEAELQRKENLYQNARRIVIWGAGHMLHYDQPDTLAEEIRNFLELDNSSRF